MIHIGTVYLKGREYSLELNQARERRAEAARQTVARKNLPTARSEVVPLGAARRSATQRAHRALQHARPTESWRQLLLPDRRQAARPHAYTLPWRADPERAVKLVSRFLSWCFPVREFNSPLHRILYLSIERPKSKYRRRFLLP